MKTKAPEPYYEPSRPASSGRWVAIIKRSENIVEHAPYHTEFEARRAMGLKGGSKDPRYAP